MIPAGFLPSICFYVFMCSSSKFLVNPNRVSIAGEWVGAYLDEHGLDITNDAHLRVVLVALCEHMCAVRDGISFLDLGCGTGMRISSGRFVDHPIESISKNVRDIDGTWNAVGMDMGERLRPPEGWRYVNTDLRQSGWHTLLSDQTFDCIFSHGLFSLSYPDHAAPSLELEDGFRPYRDFPGSREYFINRDAQYLLNAVAVPSSYRNFLHRIYVETMFLLREGGVVIVNYEHILMRVGDSLRLIAGDPSTFYPFPTEETPHVPFQKPFVYHSGW